jgi:hypothetical protein
MQYFWALFAVSPQQQWLLPLGVLVSIYSTFWYNEAGCLPFSYNLWWKPKLQCLFQTLFLAFSSKTLQWIDRHNLLLTLLFSLFCYTVFSFLCILTILFFVSGRNIYVYDVLSHSLLWGLIKVLIGIWTFIILYFRRWICSSNKGFLHFGVHQSGADSAPGM